MEEDRVAKLNGTWRNCYVQYQYHGSMKTGRVLRVIRKRKSIIPHFVIERKNNGICGALIQSTINKVPEGLILTKLDDDDDHYSYKKRASEQELIGQPRSLPSSTFTPAPLENENLSRSRAFRDEAALAQVQNSLYLTPNKQRSSAPKDSETVILTKDKLEFQGRQSFAACQNNKFNVGDQVVPITCSSTDDPPAGTVVFIGTVTVAVVQFDKSKSTIPGFKLPTETGNQYVISVRELEEVSRYRRSSRASLQSIQELVAGTSNVAPATVVGRKGSPAPKRKKRHRDQRRSREDMLREDDVAAETKQISEKTKAVLEDRRYDRPQVKPEVKKREMSLVEPPLSKVTQEERHDRHPPKLEPDKKTKEMKSPEPVLSKEEQLKHTYGAIKPGSGVFTVIPSSSVKKSTQEFSVTSPVMQPEIATLYLDDEVGKNAPPSTLTGYMPPKMENYHLTRTLSATERASQLKQMYLRNSAMANKSHLPTIIDNQTAKHASEMPREQPKTYQATVQNKPPIKHVTEVPREPPPKSYHPTVQDNKSTPTKYMTEMPMEAPATYHHVTATIPHEKIVVNEPQPPQHASVTPSTGGNYASPKVKPPPLTLHPDSVIRPAQQQMSQIPRQTSPMKVTQPLSQLYQQETVRDKQVISVPPANKKMEVTLQPVDNRQNMKPDDYTKHPAKPAVGASSIPVRRPATSPPPPKTHDGIHKMEVRNQRPTSPSKIPQLTGPSADRVKPQDFSGAAESSSKRTRTDDYHNSKFFDNPSEAFQQVVQKHEPELSYTFRGIQGSVNSCYMDAAMNALFSYSTTFDHLVTQRMKSVDKNSDDGLAEEVRKILRRDIVRPLRTDGFVPHENVWKLRSIFGTFVNNDYLGAFMDAEEFLVTLFELIKTPESLEYNTGECDFMHQIILPPLGSTLPRYLDVQTLLETSLAESDVLFARKPERGLIIKLPISDGRLVGITKGVIPNPILTIWCGKHSLPAEMNLSAVICLRHNHFVSFVKTGQASSLWLFMDSKPTTSNPESRLLHGVDEAIIRSLEEWNQGGDILGGYEELLTCNEFNLFRDAYICIYT